MTALSVTDHVAVTLSALEQLAITDHTTLEAAGVYGPAAQMAARADRWRALAEMAVLLDEDPHFAQAYAAAAVARSAALAAARHPGDQTLAAEAVDAERSQLAIAAAPRRADTRQCIICIQNGTYGVIRADGLCDRCDERAAVIADTRRLLDLLEATPALPLDRHSVRVVVHADGTDEQQWSAIDTAAATLGTPIRDSRERNGHYETALMVGLVEYEFVAISSQAMNRYRQANQLAIAAAQDEDQPTLPPAAPARGHGQDDVDQEPKDDEDQADDPGQRPRPGRLCIVCERPIATNEAVVPYTSPVDELEVFRHFDCLTDDELASALLLDEDAPVTHAPTPTGSLSPRCGADEIDPVYSNMPTCPTCRSLRAGGPADTDPGDPQ